MQKKYIHIFINLSNILEDLFDYIINGKRSSNVWCFNNFIFLFYFCKSIFSINCSTSFHCVSPNTQHTRFAQKTQRISCLLSLLLWLHKLMSCNQTHVRLESLHLFFCKLKCFYYYYYYYYWDKGFAGFFSPEINWIFMLYFSCIFGW